jgi:hypothetical protein
MSPAARPYDLSAEALQTLTATFWTSQGWRRRPQWPDPAALARAAAAGVMFSEPRVLDHDGWVSAARAAAGAVSAREVGEAFLASLTTRRLDLRSALGSYAVARYLPGHCFEVARDLSYHGYAPVGQHQCAVCGHGDQGARAQDLNVFSFERFRWGGVRRDSPAYIAFDLEQFARAPRREPSAADLGVARELFGYLRQLPPGTTAARAVPGMRMIRGNKAEREILLGILGVTGILQTTAHPGYAGAFIPAAQRHLPPYRFVFGRYPICWWTAADGVSADALRQFLPQL